MEIKASQVKELRDMSGVAMMECKRALVECEGDLDKALDLLRSNSSLKAEKKASRVAADGVIRIVSSDSYATIIEINSETDFAAKDPGFAAVPMASSNGISMIGISFLSANSFKSRADFTEIISIQRMRAHTCPP